MARIKIGRISGVSGIKGEIKLFHYSGERERIACIDELFFQCGAGVSSADSKGFQRVGVESIRYSGKTPIIKIKGIETRNVAESLIGTEVWAERDALAPLDEHSFYVDDIAGFSVRDRSGEVIGDVSGVLDNPAHDILRIMPESGKEILLPMIDEFVLSVDMELRAITVVLPDGLLDTQNSGSGSLRADDSAMYGDPEK